MSEVSETPIDAGADEGADVARWLLAHPDFLQAHPEVLLQLQVPHPAGAAVSLIERQVQALREQNQALQTQLRALVDIARDNERLIHRLHQLTLKLMRSGSPAELVRILREGLSEEFRADCVLLKVFSGAAPVHDGDLHAAPAAPERIAFGPAVAAGTPSCGRMVRTQHEAVFGPTEGEAGSAVILPIGVGAWRGLLLIASRDPARFRPDLGLEILSYLGDVTSLMLHAWIATRS
ncbi:MAG: DUF484 family protein [Gammaproteobacteria bacterium]